MNDATSTPNRPTEDPQLDQEVKTALDRYGDRARACLVLGRVVNDLWLGLVVGDVQFKPVERPRDENDRAALVVEREMADVERAVDLDDGGKHPQHVTS